MCCWPSFCPSSDDIMKNETVAVFLTFICVAVISPESISHLLSFHSMPSPQRVGLRCNISLIAALCSIDLYPLNPEPTEMPLVTYRGKIMAMNLLSMNWNWGAGPARLNSKPWSHRDHILSFFSLLFVVFTLTAVQLCGSSAPQEAKSEAAIKWPCLVYLFYAEITAGVLQVFSVLHANSPDSN